MALTETITETITGASSIPEAKAEELAALQRTRYCEAAYREFLEGVAQIEGATVEFDVNRPLVGQPIRVYVPSPESPVWKQVLDIEAAVVSRFPRSGLDVWISDYRPEIAEPANARTG